MLPSEDNTSRRKRQRDLSQDPLQASRDLTTKKRRLSSDDGFRWHRAPEDWDRLSKIWLTRSALKEFDRRSLENKQRSHTPSTNAYEGRVLTRSQSKRLQEFACKGGPDLSHLQGFSNPICNMSKRTASSNRTPSSASNRTRSSTSNRTQSTKKSSPYDGNYKQNIIDLGIYPNSLASRPSNRQEILDRLAIERPSLSPSRFQDDDFERFQVLSEEMDGEAVTMRKVMSIIEGNGQNYPSSGDFAFTRLEPLGPGLSAAKPDMYDGARPQQVDRRVRDDLDCQIVPSSKTFRPAAPNFFTEGKSEGGLANVAKLQACHDGAIGARAMNSLQNYGHETTTYDGNAYSFTNTYHGGTGTLQMYVTHPTAPKARGENPEYHMTQLRSFAMTDTADRFREGARHYRNARDLAAENRDTFIEQANAVAQRLPPNTPSNTITTSLTSKSTQPESDSDTSIDELADDNSTTKRLRRDVPQDPTRMSFTNTVDETRRQPAWHGTATTGRIEPRQRSDTVPAGTEVRTKSVHLQSVSGCDLP